MPYIYCQACGAGCYSNVTSCPGCGAPAKRAHAHHEMRHRRPRAESLRVCEDVEIEVRDALYGWRSGSVERAASDIESARSVHSVPG